MSSFIVHHPYFEELPFLVAFTRIRAVRLLWRKVGEKERGCFDREVRGLKEQDPWEGLVLLGLMVCVTCAGAGTAEPSN